MFCSFKVVSFWDFPGGPVAKTPGSQFRGPGFKPGQGTSSHMPRLKIPHAATKTQCSKLGKKYISFYGIILQNAFKEEKYLTISNIFSTIKHFYKMYFEFFSYFQFPVDTRNKDGVIR